MDCLRFCSIGALVLACCVAAGCVQNPWSEDPDLETNTLPEDELADDSRLKKVGDLGPAPLQVEPARPFSEHPYTVSIDLEGADSVAVSATGAGCGGFAATSAPVPLHLDGMAAKQGICRLLALVAMADGTTRTFTTGFEVHETDPDPLPMEVLGAVYRAGPVAPASDDGPEILTIDGPTTFVNGGSLNWLIEHQGERAIVAVLVSLEGYPGHYVLPVDDADDAVAIELQFRRDAFAWMNGARNNSLGVGVALLDSLGGLSPIAIEPIEGVPVGSGSVEVSITWDADADVDLHVTEPNGETTFYGNRESLSGGRLDLDSNPTCDLDGINAEHIFWPSHSAPSGSYQARVHLYDACSTGSVSGTLTINACDGEPAQSHAFTLSELFPELVVDFDATCAGASVSGRVRFEDFAISGSGISTSGSMVPARFVTVEAVAAEDGAVLASGHTDRTGRYSLEIPVWLLESSEPWVQIRVVAEADIPQARQKVSEKTSEADTGPVYSWLDSNRFDPMQETSVERNLEVRKADSAGALNLWDVGVSGFLYLGELGETLPPIRWWWKEGAAIGTSARGNRVKMTGSADDPDEYDDFVAGHEMGHVVMNLLSTNDQWGVGHTPEYPTYPAVAWGEGWATYFSAVINRSGRYIDSAAPGDPVYSSYSIETLPSEFPLGTYEQDAVGNVPVDPARPWDPLGTRDANIPRGELDDFLSEGVVSGILWDMHDRTNESKDTLSGLDPAHWAVMRGYLGADTAEYDGGRGYSGRDLVDLLDGWLCHHGPSRNGNNDSEGLRGNVRGIHEVPYDFPDYECH